MQNAFHEQDAPVGLNGEGAKAGAERWIGEKTEVFRFLNQDQGRLDRAK
jgi:hypothetical protein